MTVARFTAFLLTLTALLACCPVSGAESWRTYCRQAHKCAEHNELEKAIKLFHKALRVTDEDSLDEGARIDIQLNEVWFLIDAGRYDRAVPLLKVIGKKIAPYKDTLLEVRYLRRWIYLFDSEKSYSQSLEYQNQALRVIERIDNSLDRCIDRIHLNAVENLFLTCVLAGRFDQAADATETLLSIHGNSKHPPRDLTKFLQSNSFKIMGVMHNLLQMGQLERAGAIMRSLRPLCNNGLEHAQTEALLCAVATVNRNSQLQNESALALIKMSKQLPHSDAVAGLSCILMTPVFNSRQFDRFSLRSSELARRLLDDAFSDSVSKRLEYIQCVSMCALIHSRLREPAEAAAIMDKLVPDRNAFVDLFQLNGIYQARMEIAERLFRDGKPGEAKLQLKKMCATLASMNRFPNLAKCLVQWQAAATKLERQFSVVRY